MTEIKFPLGSVVMLKGGSPHMTITSYLDGVPVCEYFVNGESRKSKYYKESLMLVIPKEAGDESPSS